ncbi:Na+/H+ antiporter Nha1 [Ceratobasidium theobromae]|uniref:Na+/H+ antiporter Nha1 n=1 Tax=Ceratobasidium theobromae TaxID=1582974 RepID=A0A5N5QXP7_9AGAM|nr:Na+/H+ antiporter Nha1 [Ceratobasidium theobromae]
MTFAPFDVSTPHLAYTVLGGFVVMFGMFSLLIREKAYIGEAVIATVFGIIIGPYVAGIFDPRGWASSHEVVNEITLEVTRVVLAIGVFAIGVELPKQYMLKHWRSLFYLLVPVMTYGWFISAALIYALIPNLTFLSSLVIAACLTPTDPILAAAVVGGKYADKHVPKHLTNLLKAESGCNDGAAFPFLFIAIYLIIEQSDRVAVGEWFYVTWLYEVALGIAFGAVLGFGFRHLMRFCERKDLIDRQSYVAQYVSLAILTIGATTLLGSDDLLAAFACGTAFAWDGWFNRQTEESMFSNVIDLLFNCACFIFIGAWIPFEDFDAPELSISPWRLIVLGLLVVILRRLPIMLALYKWIPDIHTFRECVFAGHFGPMGVGAVFISTLAAVKLPDPKEISKNGELAEGGTPAQIDYLGHSIQPIVAFMVLISIMIHGLSIPFFSLGKRVHSIRHTWSRHNTVEGGRPEWANQTRQIQPGEEIVVNRDDAAERGEMGYDEKRASAPTSVGEGSSGSVEGREHGTGEHVVSAEGRHGRMGVAFDDTQDVETTEWREGQDLVIERSPGRGEEIEVEVIRNAYAPRSRSNSATERTLTSHTISGKQEEVQNQLVDHLHAIQREAAEVGEKLGITHSNESSRDRHATGVAAGPSQPHQSTSKSSDEEADNSDPPTPTIVVPDEEEEDRSRSHTRELRNHVRDRLLARQRGSDRSNGHSRPGSAGGSLPRDPAARLRAGSVRDSRRDVSPARSIRFADDRPVSSGEGSSVSPGAIGNGTGETTPGSRVMFDLPAQKPR